MAIADFFFSFAQAIADVIAGSVGIENQRARRAFNLLMAIVAVIIFFAVVIYLSGDAE